MSPPLELLRKRALTLASGWVAAALAVVLAAGIPWYLRLLEVDLRTLAGGGAILAGAALAASFAIARAGRRSSIVALCAGLQILGALELAWAWHLLGGVGLPLGAVLSLLVPALAFLVPVRGIGLLSTGAPLLLLWATAWLESAALRRLLLQLGLPLADLAGRSPVLSPTDGLQVDAPSVFSGLVLVSGVVLLLGALLEVAAHGSPLATPAAASPEAMALGRTREALALVEMPSGRIRSASDGLRDRFLVPGSADLSEHTLVELLRPAWREAVDELLAGGGTAEAVPVRIGPEMRVVRLRIDPVDDDAGRLGLVHLVELTGARALQVALDGAGEARIVLDGEERILYASRSARELVPGAEVGRAAEEALPTSAEDGAWWRPDPAGPEVRTIRGDGRALAVRTRIAAGDPARPTLVLLSLERRDPEAAGRRAPPEGPGDG